MAVEVSGSLHSSLHRKEAMSETPTEATEEQVIAYLKKQDKANITPAVADACAAVVDRIDYMGSTEPYGA